MEHFDSNSSPDQDRRKATRTSPDRRMFVSLEGEAVRVAELSCHGITLHGPLLTVGTRVQLEIHLGKYHLSAPVEILRTSGSNRSHGQFVDLGDDDRAALGSYVDELLVSGD